MRRSWSGARRPAASSRPGPGAHVQESRPRFTVSREDSTRLAEAFLTATRTGDAQALTRLLAKDAVLHSDGGGKRPVALRPIAGRGKIIRFFVGLAGKADLTGAYVYTAARINGQPGYVIAERDGSETSVALELRDGLIASIYIMRNPEKLGHLLKTSG